MTHIMIDLETLATAPDAGIIQIGAQAFDPEAETDEQVLLGAGFEVNVDPQAVMNAGMRVDWSTLHWWMSQPDAFRTLAAPGEGYMLTEALGRLFEFVNANGGSWAKVWSNGAAFDIPILEMSYLRCRMKAPWSYNNVLDVRTMKWLAPLVDKVVPELAHNALSDARAQAMYVARCHRAIKGATGWKPPVYADTSMSAQVARIALEALWAELGASNQTEAVERLKELKARPVPAHELTGASSHSTIVDDVDL